MAATFHNVLIAGSTGNLGRKITESFLDKKTFRVSILTRPGNKDEKKAQTIEQLKAKGAVVVEADTQDPASLQKAFQGIDLIVSALNGPGLGEQVTLIRAAKEAGVKRFVPSEFGIDVELPRKHGHPIEILEGKVAVREELRKVQLEHVLVSSGLFYEYQLAILGIDLEKGEVHFPGSGHEKFGTTSTSDIARLLPDIATHPNAANKTVILAGAFVSGEEIFGYIEEITGKKLARHYIPADQYKALVDAEQVPFKRFFLQLKHLLGLGILGTQTPNYEEFTHEKPTPLKEFFAQTLKK